MLYFHLLIALHLTVCIAYKNNCPGPSERKLRASAFCNISSVFKYSCLYDENSGDNVESCKTAVDFSPPGYKYVLRGQADFTPCARNRYQPFRLWSNVSGQCLFKKSQCDGDGQLLYDNGTTESDRSCRCDFTHGYAFINKPRHPCKCVPSEEDCSCYKKYCPNNTVLSPDYNCAQEDDMRGKERYGCPIIVYYRLSTNSYSINGYTNVRNDLSHELIACVVTVICTLLLIIVEGLLVIICNEEQEHKFIVTPSISTFDDTERGRCLRKSETSEESTITTKEPIPPRDLKASTDFKGIHLSWSVPEYATLVETQYFIGEIKVENNKIRNVSSDKTCALISEVFPSTSYSIRMSTCIRTGNEMPTDENQSNAIKTVSEYTGWIQCKTPEPFPPKDLKAVPDFKGIFLTWSIPEYPKLDNILHFIVVVEAGYKKNIKVSSKKTSYQISDVFPSTSYSIRMSTCVRTGYEIPTDDNQLNAVTAESEFTDSIKCTTPERLPPKESGITGVAKSIKSKAKTFWSGS